MRWIIDLEGQHPIALDWARDFFSEFDTSQLAWIRVDRGRGKNRGAYGRCWYPNRRIPFYRISCQVPGRFPCEIPTRKSPLYFSPDGSHPPLPPGTRFGDHVRDLRTGREWYRVIGSTLVQDLDEAIVWVLAHEAFHFLRRSRQIPGRNTEIEADRFADDRLLFYRTGR
ncbi:MAG: hypothetical protein ABSC61_08110 [Anaerolineales bacterium]